MPNTERQPASSLAITDAPTRLSGSWRIVARVVWLLLLLATLAYFASQVPAYLNSVTHTTAETDLLTPGAAEALRQLGIGLDTFGLVATVVAGAIVLVTLILSLVLVWRRGDDWMALLISLFLVVNTVGNIGVASDIAPTSGSATVLILYVLQQVIFATLYYTGFLLFPNGRFVPRWSWLLLVAFVVWMVVASLTNMEILGGALVLGYPLFYGAALVNIVYRYRHAMTTVQQQQTKWVIAGLAASLLANQIFWLPSGLTPLGNTIYLPLSYLAYQIVLLVVPITFFIAIQRYRLYDIDTILNRALVYGSLTTILAVIYVGGIVGLQALVNRLTPALDNGGSSLVIVVTTLLIAALFQPLRQRIQALIDRRFYRRKYDTARTLAAFGTTLRQEVDLPTITGNLVEVVQETMQPAHISLWLRQTANHPRHRGITSQEL